MKATAKGNLWDNRRSELVDAIQLLPVWVAEQTEGGGDAAAPPARERETKRREEEKKNEKKRNDGKYKGENRIVWLWCGVYYTV